MAVTIAPDESAARLGAGWNESSGNWEFTL